MTAEAPRAGRRPSIVSHTTFILVGQLLSAIVLIVTTPYIALGLGAERYGLYTLLFLLLGYSAALDFGLSFSLVKHIAEYDLETQREEIDSFVSTAMIAYGAVAATFVTVLIGGREWIANSLLHVPPALETAALKSIVFLGCAVPFATAGTLFAAIFRGLLRFHYVALFSLANASVYSVGAALLVSSSASFDTVIAWYAAVTVVSVFAQWMVLRRIIPNFRPVPRLDVKRLGQLYRFGSFMAFNQVGSIALLQLDRLVIARLLPISMVAYYAVPVTISQRLNMLGAAAATVTFPHSSASTARGEVTEFRRQYLQGARVVAWLTLAPALTVMTLADQILRYWLSPEFALHGTIVLRLVAFGVLWISIASLDAVSIEGSGRPWVTSLFMVITGGMNVAGLLVLIPRWGLGGAAVSVAFSLLALAALDVWYGSKNVTRSSVTAWGHSVILPMVWTTLLALPVTFFLRKVVHGLPSLIAASVAGTCFTVFVGYWFFLVAQERRWLLERAVGLWSLIRGAQGQRGGS